MFKLPEGLIGPAETHIGLALTEKWIETVRIPRGGRLEVQESAGSIPLVQSDVAQIIESGRKIRADFKFFLELLNRLRILSALPIHETEIKMQAGHQGRLLNGLLEFGDRSRPIFLNVIGFAEKDVNEYRIRTSALQCRKCPAGVFLIALRLVNLDEREQRVRILRHGRADLFEFRLCLGRAIQHQQRVTELIACSEVSGAQLFRAAQRFQSRGLIAREKGARTEIAQYIGIIRVESSSRIQLADGVGIAALLQVQCAQIVVNHKRLRIHFLGGQQKFFGAAQVLPLQPLFR